MDAIVTVIAVVLALHVVVKFCFFALPYRFRRRQLDRSYRGRPRATQVSDPVSLALVVVLVVLLFVDGVAPPSFLIGLWVGATLVQTYFHRFHAPLDPEHAPPAPNSPIKTMSYAIQAAPRRAWQEMTLFTVFSALGLVAFALI